MYNRMLETFLRVAALGSFSAAAESMFISQSAVTQQINSLEDHLNAVLFVRTNRGITLTDAGRYLQGEASDYIRKGKEISQKVASISSGDRPIRVGTRVEYKIRLITDLWQGFQKKSNFDIEVIELQKDMSDAGTMDIIESIRSCAEWQKGFDFVKLMESPLAAAICRNHPLIGKETLTLHDMTAYGIIIWANCMPPKVSEVLSVLTAHGIYYELVHECGPAVAWDCTKENRIFLCPACWYDVFPDLIVRPVEWDFQLDYGFFCSQPVKARCSEYIKYARSTIAQGSGFDERGMVPAVML